MHHRVLWPEEEGPQVLYSDCWGPAFRGIMEPSASFNAWICIGEGKDAAKKMLHTAWKQEYAAKKPVRKTEEVWKLSSDYARLLYTEEEDGLRAFSIGFTWNGKDVYKRQLETMRDEIYTKIIIGESSIDDFDTFVADFNKLGGDDMTAEVNEWYSSVK